MDDQTLYFKNGVLYEIEPDDGRNRYKARFFISDGTKHDLDTLTGVETIQIPDFSDFSYEGYGVTGRLDYVLRMKASHLRDNKKIQESDALYFRIPDFMAASNIGWMEEDYLRYSHILLTEGRFKESENEEARITAFLDNLQFKNGTYFRNISEQLFFKTLESCKYLGTDLIQMSAHCSCCELCNKLQGRIYSISGKDKRFPKLPDYIIRHGTVHKGCRHSFSHFILYDDDDNVINNKLNEESNVFEASNRPFIDDRTEEEKENYIEFRNQQKEKEKKKRDEKEYFKIFYRFPDYAPKSFVGYRRMKHLNSTNFQELMQIAEEAGIDIEF
ncbi:phage minor capsid protein [Lachnospiraceae bacterium 54-53]